jgi:hypothetical protein
VLDAGARIARRSKPAIRPGKSMGIAASTVTLARLGAGGNRDVGTVGGDVKLPLRAALVGMG